ncbi:MAG: UDP-N-acetylglucosamine 1-carboxyvinyltransferase, partial [Syntrophomonadaceae bacterium]
ENLPDVADIRTLGKLLQHIGAEVVRDRRCAAIEVRTIGSADAPYDLVKTMRASVLVLGPLLARVGEVRVSLPGGCAIGVRPINLHLAAFEKLGAEVRLEHGYVEARAARLRGADVAFDTVTVTGTENVMLAATLARGTTRLLNAAREPEVVDLAELLVAMGARITGAGTDTIVIEGVEALHGADHAVIPDRIEAGTYALAAAATRGDVRIARCAPEHLGALLSRLRATGATVEASGDTLRVRAEGALASHDVATAPYPGFPTDLQAQWMALATGLEGMATITETIFENRFQHVAELVRMGARIRLEGRWAVVEGPSRLTGARVMASDLRASAALVIAGLAAEGETTIERVYHLDRGYQRLEEKLRALGARVRRVQ